MTALLKTPQRLASAAAALSLVVMANVAVPPSAHSAEKTTPAARAGAAKKAAATQKTTPPPQAPAAAPPTSAKTPDSPLRGLGSTQPNAAPLREADHIVAIVNAEPITRSDVVRRTQRVLQNLREQGSTSAELPSPEQLAPQVLEQLIVEKAQVHRAHEIGLDADDWTVEQAAANIAAQNGIAPQQLDAALQSQGIDPTTFRQDLREQILMQRLREREVDARVRVSDADIDQYLRDQPASASEPQLALGHILIAVPEAADAPTVAAARERAAAAAAAIARGASLEEVARQWNSAATAPVMEARPASRYPQLFVQATANLAPGAISEPVRSAAGFHVLQVLERSSGLVPSTVVQTHARHILLRPSAQMNERASAAQLQELRQRIVLGRASFEDIARSHSQDGSAAEGGDLGWAMPGQFVPEFEQAMNQLEPGQISPIVPSRFGLHLIRVDERRRAQLTPEQQREMLARIVREEKLEKAQANWLQELRQQAWVEYREQP